MSYSWGALAGSFLGPFVFGLYSKKVTVPAVWTSFILGVGGTIGHMILFGFGWFPALTKSAASLPLKKENEEETEESENDTEETATAETNEGTAAK